MGRGMIQRTVHFRQKGQNAIRLDISNEMDTIFTNSAGVIQLARTVETVVHLYDGATEVDISAVTFSPSGGPASSIATFSQSASGQGKKLSWAFIVGQTMADAYEIAISYTYNGVPYSAVFSVTASKGSAIWQLRPAMAAIPFSRNADNTLTPASQNVGLKLLKIDGSSTTEYTSVQTGIVVRYSTEEMPASKTAGTNWSSGDITVANSASNLYIAMFNSAGTLLDRETIPVVCDGENGSSGANAIRLDISNEMDSVFTNSAGLIEQARTVETVVHLYDGATEVDISAVTFSPSGGPASSIATFSQSASGQGKKLSWAFIAGQTMADAYEIAISYTYNDVPYSAVFSVTASKGSAIWQLRPAMAAIPFSRNADNTLTPASQNVGLKLLKIDGSSTTEYSSVQTGIVVRYSTEEMPASKTAGTNWSSGDITVANSASNLYIAMFNSAGTLLDRETIPVVCDGENGDQGDTVWQAQAFKIFDVDPGSDKPTKTTEITTATTDFGNDWKKNPETPTVRDIYVDDTGLNINIGGMTVWADMINTDPNYSVFGKGWRIAKGNKQNSSNNKYVVDRIKFTPLTDNEVFRLQIAASAEMGYDGVTVGNLNEAATISTNWGDSDKSTKGATKNAIIDVTILVTDKANQECFFDIIFKKDSTTHSNDDCGYYKLTTRGGKVYSSIATIENGTVVGSWSTATQWQGNDGPEGDGIVSVVRTYAISNVNTTASDTTEPAHQGSWSESSPAVTEQYPYLWAREVVTYKFAAATTKYYCIGSRGDNGVDAQDVEWVFIRSKNATAPIIYNDSSYTDTNGKTYTSDDHLPQVSGSENIEMNNNRYQCTDDPKGVDSTWKYEWETKRTKGTADANGRRTWNYYQGAMTLHNNYAESAFIIDLSNDNDQFGTDSDSKVQVTQVRQTIVSLYDGATKQTLTALTATLTYEDGTSVPSGVATVTATAATGVVEVTVLQNSTANTHSEIRANITATCAKGSKQTVFTLRKVMGGAPGLNPIIYQLAPTNKTFSFSRNNSNGLTPASRSTTINVARTEGNSTTILTSAQTGITYQWGFDDGATDKSADVTFSVDTANTTIDSSNYSLIGRVLTVTALHTPNQTAQDGYVTLQCTYNGVTYKAKFTVKAIVNQDKFALDVNPNALFLNTDDGWDASKTIAVKVMRTPAGGGTPSAVNPSTYGLAVSASIGTLSSYNTTTNSFTLTITQAQATDNADTVIDIHKSDDATKVYDRETIPFNKAENGDNGANAIRMDIDNEYDSIQYQGDGKTKIGGNVSTTAYLYDGATAQETDKAVGTSISITNTQANTHYQVWVELSTGDRETLPIVKDGVNGELYVIETNVDSVTIPSNHTYVNADITGQFYKLTGGNKASHTCAFIMWKRSKTGTYTRVANSSSVNSFDLSDLQVTNDTDALVAVMQTTLTNDPTVYIAKKEIAVICDGATGATGRMFYLVGIWSPDVNYGRTDMLIPLVWRDSNTQDPATGNFGNYWYLSADSSLNHDPNTDGGAHWTKAESFGFVITQGIFAQFAKFGSAVITGDWMISGNGKIDGVDFTVDQLVTGLTVDSGSTEWNTRAYTLFDALNPRATSRSLLYGKNKNLAASGSHTLHIDNVTLSASETYSIRVYGYAGYLSATPHVFVKVQRTGVGATDVLALDDVGSSHNQQAFFRVAEDGEYSVDIYETAHSSSYSGATIDFIEVAKVAFAPVYAVDLLTGGSIQRDMMTSGFIRKDKTVINRLNVDYYVYGQYDNKLVLERCGSFIELRDNVSVQLWPFVLCNQYRSLENAQLTEEEKDYIRSLVGTKMLIYLKDEAEINKEFLVTNGWFTTAGYTQHREVKIDGVTQTEPASGSGSVDVSNAFLYRVTYDHYLNPRSGDYENHYVWEFRSLHAGQFAEIECVTDVDEDGYEIVCWRVNSVGNIV